MAKVFNFNTTVDSLLKEGRDRCAEEKYIDALVSFRTALKYCRNKKQKSEVYFDIARVYTFRCKYIYANEILFRLLINDPKNIDYKVLLLFNFIALSDHEIADYYFNQIRYEFNDDFKKISEMAKSKFSLQIQDQFGELDEDTIDEILERFEDEEDEPFIMIDDDYRFEEKIAALCECVNNGDYAQAIDFANEALKYNVAENKKGVAYYSKGMSLMALNYCDETKKICQEWLKKDPKDVNMQMLYCLALANLGEKEELEIAIEPILKSDELLIKFSNKLARILIKCKMYDEALIVINRHLKLFPDSHTIGILKGICLFNKGQKNEARETFAYINGLYGDISYVIHFIRYLDENMDEPIPVEAIDGDWKVVSYKYIEHFDKIISLSLDSFARYVKENRKILFERFKWLATGMRARVIFQFVSMLFAIIPYEDYSKKLINIIKEIDILKNQIIDMVGYNIYLDKYVKIHILTECIHSEYMHSIPVVTNEKFYIADFKEFYEYGFNEKIYSAFTNAIAVSICESEESFKKVMNFMKNFHKVQSKYDFRWNKLGSIVALILELSLGRDITMIDDKVDYTKATLEKYKKELLEVATVEELNK